MFLTSSGSTIEPVPLKKSVLVANNFAGKCPLKYGVFLGMFFQIQWWSSENWEELDNYCSLCR